MGIQSARHLEFYCDVCSSGNLKVGCLVLAWDEQSFHKTCHPSHTHACDPGITVKDGTVDLTNGRRSHWLGGHVEGCDEEREMVIHLASVHRHHHHHRHSRRPHSDDT